MNLAEAEAHIADIQRLERELRVARRQTFAALAQTEPEEMEAPEQALIPHDDDLPLEGFALPEAIEAIPSIRKPVIRANNFELRPQTIQQLQSHSTFAGG
ncbi:hypothetical protein PSY31_22405, partial [Shigella flexneri]|nr:hypothetical protein [Shigella flexneri]